MKENTDRERVVKGGNEDGGRSLEVKESGRDDERKNKGIEGG